MTTTMNIYFFNEIKFLKSLIELNLGNKSKNKSCHLL